MSDVLTLERRGHVAELTLNRPKANAIDAPTSRAMAKVVAEFKNDPDLWVGIFTGTGRFFSAGWDLKAAAAGETTDIKDYGEGGFGGITENWDLNKPLIAAVNGYAAGGGFELALACDIIIASTTASFMLSEVNSGLTPGGGGIIHLPHRIPYGLAMEMLYTGRSMKPDEALRVGLVNRVVEPDQLMDAAREIADDIVTSAPLAVQAVKSVLRDIEGLSARDAYVAQERNAENIKVQTSEDFQEGPRAFAEKRAPEWKAR